MYYSFSLTKSKRTSFPFCFWNFGKYSYAIFFESLIPEGLSAALFVVVLAPFVEELAKVFPLFYRHGETERSLVTLGPFTGLSFDVAEFAEYVFLTCARVIGSISQPVFMFQLQL